MKQKVQTIIPIAAWVLQLGAELFLLYSILKLNMLPLNWMAAAFFLALIAFAVLTAVLLFLPKRDSQYISIRQAIAIVLALLVTAGCIFASTAVFRLSKTVSTVTGGSVADVTVLVGVYVRADDAAENLSDAAGYTFAVDESDGDAYLSQALEYIEAEAGDEIQTVNYDSVTDMVDALYSQEVQAIIMSEAFVDVLTELDDYADFSSETKEIYRASVIRKDASTLTSGKTGNEETTAPSETQSDDTSVKAEITTKPFLLYLSGSDTRDQMLTTSRSDVNIIAAVNPNTKQVLLINTPRDYYVANPAGNGALDKLTHCGIYGIDCSMQALAELYQEEIDYYAQINFTGFETLIDAIGGITVYSDIAFTAITTELHVGDNYLDGKGALNFARERKSLSGGDNDRGKHQMEVIKGVVQKLSAGTILTHYSDIMESLEGMFITSVSSEEVSSLVRMQLSDMAEWDVFTYAATGTGGSNTTYSMPGRNLYVMYPNEETVAHATELIDRLVAGETLTESDVAQS